MYKPPWERNKDEPNIPLDIPLSQRKTEGRVAILDVVFDAYWFVIRNYAAFLFYALAPIIVSSLLTAVVAFSNIPQTVNEFFLDWIGFDPDLSLNSLQLISFSSPSIATVMSIVLYIIDSLIIVSFSVAWHRRCLLGLKQASATELLVWRPRHLRFLGYGVVLTAFLISVTLFLSVVATPFTTIAGTLFGLVILLLSLFAMIYVVTNVALAFPAAAVDDPHTGLLESCDLSHGHKWKIGVILFAGVLIPSEIVLWGTAKLFYTQGPLNPWFSSIGSGAAVILIMNLINYVYIAVGVTALSILYKDIVDYAPIPREPAEPGTV